VAFGVGIGGVSFFTRVAFAGTIGLTAITVVV